MIPKNEITYTRLSNVLTLKLIGVYPQSHRQAARDWLERYNKAGKIRAINRVSEFTCIIKVELKTNSFIF